MSRPRQAAHTLISTLLLAVTAACSAGPPCPEGVHEGSLFIEDDEYFVSGGAFGGTLSYGKVGEAGVEECREIRGGLVAQGNVSSFADFDGLEVVSGSVSFQGGGYPMGTVLGSDQQVIEGFERLLRVGGSLGGPWITGMSSLETVGGDLRAPTTALISLRDVGGNLAAGGDGNLQHLGALETVGGDLITPFGDLDSLVSLRSVGLDLFVGNASEVTFVLPALETVGGDLWVRNNDAIGDVAVPVLLSVGGDLFFTGNSNSTGLRGTTSRARVAFADVEVGGATLICRNAADDPCPYDDECWDFYDESYCCPIDMGTVQCIESLAEGG